MVGEHLAVQGVGEDLVVPEARAAVLGLAGVAAEELGRFVPQLRRVHCDTVQHSEISVAMLQTRNTFWETIQQGEYARM